MIIYAKTIIPSEQWMLKSLLFFGGEKIYTKFGPNFDPNYIRTCEKSAIKLLKTYRHNTLSFSNLQLCVFHFSNVRFAIEA